LHRPRRQLRAGDGISSADGGTKSGWSKRPSAEAPQVDQRAGARIVGAAGSARHVHRVRQHIKERRRQTCQLPA
jgi:hypothetical protein